jgi:type II secretory pathway component GspD/PulD (secretin)
MRIHSFRVSLSAAVMVMVSSSLPSAHSFQPPDSVRNGSSDDRSPLPVKKKEPSSKREDVHAEKPPEMYEFIMRDKPWPAVFEWLTDQSGIPFSSPLVVRGTFNFISPKGKKYTLPEIIDHINDALLSQPPSSRYILVRREKNFTLLPADEKILPEQLPEIEISDLDKHGSTEMAIVVVQLKYQVAEEVAPEIRKVKGSFGEVLALKPNTLILTDTVKNLKRLLKRLREMDDGGSMRVLTLEQGNAASLAEALEKMLPQIRENPVKAIRPASNGAATGK